MEGWALIDQLGQWRDVSQSVCDILGYSKEEFVSLSMSAIIARSPDEVSKLMSAAVAWRRVEVVDPHKRRDGMFVPVKYMRLEAMRDRPGLIHCAIKYRRNVTKRALPHICTDMPVTETPQKLETDAPSIQDRIDNYQRDSLQDGLNAKYIKLVCGSVRRAAKRFAWLYVTDATEDDVRLFLAELKGQGKAGEEKPVTPKAYNNILGNFSAFFKYAVRRGWLDTSPAAGIGRVTDTRGEVVRPFTPAELTKLCDWVSEHRKGGEKAAKIYRFTAWTGLRRSELEELRWCDVHLEADQPYLELQPWQSKGGKRSGRKEQVPLVSREILAMLREMNHDVLPTEKVWGKAPHPNVVQRDIDRAGIERVDVHGAKLTLHSLRHTLGTLMAAEGVPNKVIQVLMRHRDIKTTMDVYASDSHMPTATHLRRLENILGSNPEKCVDNLERVTIPSAVTPSTNEETRMVAQVGQSGMQVNEASEWAQQDSNL